MHLSVSSLYPVTARKLVLPHTKTKQRYLAISILHPPYLLSSKLVSSTLLLVWLDTFYKKRLYCFYILAYSFSLFLIHLINLFLPFQSVLLSSTLFFCRFIYWLVSSPSSFSIHHPSPLYIPSLPRYSLLSFFVTSFLFFLDSSLHFSQHFCLIFPSPLPRPLSLIKLYLIHLGLSLALAKLCTLP